MAATVEGLKDQLSAINTDILGLQERIKGMQILNGEIEDPVRTYGEGLSYNYNNSAVATMLNKKPIRSYSKKWSVEAISWAPDSRRLLYVTREGIVMIQDMLTGIKSFMVQDNGGFCTVCSFDPFAGKYIATGGLDNQVSIYIPTSQEELKPESEEEVEKALTLMGHEGYISGIAWLSKDQILTASGDHLVKLYDLDTGICKHTFKGHSSDLSCITTLKSRNSGRLPNPNVFLTGSIDKTVRLWDARTPAPNTVGPIFLDSQVNDIRALNENVFGCCVENGEAMIFDIRSMQQLQHIAVVQSAGTSGDWIIPNLKKMEFSSSGKYMFLGDDDGTLFYVDTLTESYAKETPYIKVIQDPAPIRGLEVSPDGTALCVANGVEAGVDCKIQVFA